MSVPRMRTLPEAVAEIKKIDADTAITLTALRRMVKQGIVPSFSVGSKRLVCLDLLLDMMEYPETAETVNNTNNGNIRRVERNNADGN